MVLLANGRAWSYDGSGAHCRQYAQKKIPYAINRYTNEVNRLYGVMNRRIKDRDYLGGCNLIADMACWSWIVPYKNQVQQLKDFPHLSGGFERAVPVLPPNGVSTLAAMAQGNISGQYQRCQSGLQSPIWVTRTTH